MSFSFERFHPVRLGMIGAFVADGTSAYAAAGPAVHSAGTFDFLLAALMLLVGAVVCFWVSRGAKRETARQFEERVRKMTALIEHADCVLWEADVELHRDGWKWLFTVHKSALSRRLMDETLPAIRERLWYGLYEVPEHPEMKQRAREALERGLPGYEQEFQLRRNGVTLRMHERVSITRRAEGRFWLVGLATDRTALHEAEVARQQSEQVVERILAHAHCLLWRATVVRENDEFRWTHFDVPFSQFSELLFGDRSVPPERGLWETIEVPQMEEMNQRSTRALAEGATGYSQQFRAINKQGRIFWLHEQVSIVRTSDRTWSLVGVATDITAWHEAEEGRRRSESRLSALLELADCLVWEASIKVLPGGLLDWSLYTQRSVLYRRLFGDGDQTELNWQKLNVPEITEMAHRAAAAIRDRARGYTQEFHVERPEGAIWLREIVNMTQLPTGDFRLVGVITDITAQRVAEQAHALSRFRLEQLLDKADCMLWEAVVEQLGSAEYRWRMFTPRSRLFRQLFGRDPEGDFQINWYLHPVPELEEMRERARVAMTTGLPGYEQVFHLAKPDGDVWLSERVSIKSLGPGRWELVGIITDITAEHVAEVARQASEARLREILERADCLLWESTTMLEDGAWRWNLRIQPSGLWSRLLGEQVPASDTLWDHFEIPERAEMDVRCLEALRAGRAGYEQVFHIRRKDAPPIWISESVTIKAIDGRKFSLVGVAVDISPQRGAEMALAAEKERLSVTLRAMNEAVVTTDVGGLIQYMNAAAAELTGWTEKDAFGRAVGEVCLLEHNRSGQAIEVPVKRVARGDAVVDLPPQSRVVTRAGQRRLVEGCCAPIHAQDSKVIGMVLVFRDVTEQDRLEQELVRATRLESVGVLAGGIAHDFNNILTAVMGNLALAQLDVPDDSPAAGSLRSAEKAALRARDLTQQLLTFSKGGEPVRAAIQLEAVVREMTSFALHGSQVKAFFDLAPDLWPADADKGQIGRVVQNLVINAVQAMPGGGTLRVTARNQDLEAYQLPGLAGGHYLHITISDTGEGIRSEHLPQIFDPYFTTKATGTGLGLAAVYSIVKKHRGHIDVESQVGQGTTFRLWLPALRSAPPQFESRPPMPLGQLTGRVLFMDDEEIIREMASQLLERLGLEVECTMDGAEAVRHYAASIEAGRRFDAVIMDLTVPGGMGGLAALRELLALDPAVKAIVSSGYSSDPVLANFRQHGFVGMIAKPYEADEFARVLRLVLMEN